MFDQGNYILIDTPKITIIWSKYILKEINFRSAIYYCFIHIFGFVIAIDKGKQGG